MTKLNEIEIQIDNLRVEKLRIHQCQKAIGEFIFELYQDGGIHDEMINLELSLIINKIHPSKDDLFGGYL